MCRNEAKLTNDEPKFFSSSSFKTTILSGINASCKLNIEEENEHPLKHFLNFAVFCVTTMNTLKSVTDDFIYLLWQVEEGMHVALNIAKFWSKRKYVLFNVRWMTFQATEKLYFYVHR